MAYMRGDCYIRDDVSGVHIWAADGYDGWDESGWHLDDPGDGTFPVQSGHLKDAECTASGVSLHQEIMDEYVMMRLAELLEDGKAESAIDRALDPNSFGGGNSGGEALKANASRLKEVLRQFRVQTAKSE